MIQTTAHAHHDPLFVFFVMRRGVDGVSRMVRQAEWTSLRIYTISVSQSVSHLLYSKWWWENLSKTTKSMILEIDNRSPSLKLPEETCPICNICPSSAWSVGESHSLLHFSSNCILHNSVLSFFVGGFKKEESTDLESNPNGASITGVATFGSTMSWSKKEPIRLAE